MVIWIILISIAITGVREFITFFMRGKKKTINHMTKRITEHESFKSLNEAAEKRFESIEKRLEIMRDEYRSFFLLISGNSLKNIYYELIKMDTFNKSMYEDFLKLLKEYEAKGGNGMVLGYKDILAARWKEQMRNM